MGFLQLYARVLAKLGADRRLGWLLALANIAVASALFAEPVLFGRVINVLAAAQADVESVDWTRLWVLIVVWAGLGLFTILCGTLIALVSDRLAHRRRLAVLTGYFEHVLQLPLAYHGETHSGRLMKIMLQGTDALIFAVRHRTYLALDPKDVVETAGGPLAVIDCFGILDDDTIKRSFELGCEVKGLGRGHVKRIKDRVRDEKEQMLLQIGARQRK